MYDVFDCQVELKDTIYIGEYDQNEMILGHTVYFDSYSHVPYAMISHQLSLAFFQAEFLAKKGYKKTLRIDILISSWSLGKLKENDAEECLDRIKLWIKNMVPPGCPLIINLWVYLQTEMDLVNHSSTDQFNALWPLQKSNKYENKKYITFQPYEINDDPNEGKYNPRKNPEDLYLQSFIKDEAKRKNIEIKIIDYTTPLQEAIDLVSSSLTHFSYFGASYYIAAALNKKSYIFGYNFPKRKKAIEHEHGAFFIGPWAGNKVTQLQPSTKKIHSSAVTHFEHITSIDEIKTIFNGF